VGVLELMISVLLASHGAAASGIAKHLERAYRAGASELDAIVVFEAAMVYGGSPTLIRCLEAFAEAHERMERNDRAEPR
jgi:alkylhydroperoxidase/carboxymuconolactone decarboxylase family protein YurZ